MRTTTIIQTRRGICSLIARKWELLNVTLTLRWAERDHAHHAQQYGASANLPAVVRQLELDIARLRVQQAILRRS